MGPEFLGAGFVFLQRFLLCADLRDPRNRENSDARKNGSMESRCHCVTPCAARIEPRLFVLNATKTSFWPAVEADGEKLAHLGEERSARRAALAGAKDLRRNFFEAAS